MKLGGGKKHKQDISAVVGTGGSSPNTFLRSVLVIIALVVVCGAAYLIYQNRNKSEELVLSDVCDKYIVDVAPALRSNNSQELKPVIDRIKLEPDFEKDPNCLYPIIAYNLAISDINEARTFFNTFKAVYNPTVGLKAPYNNYVKSVNDIEERITLLEQNQQKVMDGALFSD